MSQNNAKPYRTNHSQNPTSELNSQNYFAPLDEKAQILKSESNQAALQEMFEAWLLTDAADIPEERQRMVELMKILRSL